MVERLEQQFEADPKKPAFNPGGGVFTECIGCGEGGRIPGISKGLCSMCQMRKDVSKKLDTYRKKANEKYLAITSKEKF